MLRLVSDIFPTLTNLSIKQTMFISRNDRTCKHTMWAKQRALNTYKESQWNRVIT